MYRERYGIADPDDSWLYLIGVLLLALVVWLRYAIPDGFRWLWRVFLCEFIFCCVFMILVAFVWLAIGYRGVGG